MTRKNLCVACGADAPPTSTAFTLISQEFGWRLARRERANGEIAIEWRCPACWAAYRRGTGELRRRV